MMHIGKLILVAGVVLVIVGATLWLAGRFGFRGLPGDIHYQGDNVRFHFPIVTCLLVSAVLTGILWLLSKLFR